MSSATYLQHMLADSDPDLGMPEVANFYAERNVLLTGGSGFLGKLVMDKILRSCSRVNKIYLLLREKKGKTPEERFEELFKDEIFDRLKREQPGFARKVVLIEGDMAQVGLGLTSEQRELIRSTNIVIHGAATVRFDAALRSAASINVRGTQELLSLAKEMVDLKAFVHISTAYSHCVQKEIDEKFYPSPIDSDKLLSMLDILDDAALEHLTPLLLGKWPNTYAFTKAVAEDVVRRNGQGLPLCIVRPSIMMATYKEPVSGWINSIYTGPTGILVGTAVGLLHTLHCDDDLVTDLIPADFVINSVIVAAWGIAKSQARIPNNLDDPMAPKVEDPTIYNVVSSCQNPITWRQLSDATEKYAPEVASTQCIWHYFFITTKHLWVYNLLVFLLHFIPGAIVDSMCLLTGRKPMLVAGYKKIAKFNAITRYFSLQQWRFADKNVQELWNKLSPADRSEFDFDISNLDWDDYHYNHVRGLRRYILKDPLDTVPEGRVKYVKQQIIHYVVVTVLCGILLWVLWAILMRLVSLW